MSKKITDLTQLTTPHATDMMVIDDLTAGSTKKVAVSDLLRTSGGVTPQYISNPYKFRVYLTAAQNTTSGADAKVLFDTRSFDTSSNVDITTNKGRFTAPIAGFYQFNATVTASLSGTAIYQPKIYKNGSLWSGGSSISWSVTAAGISAVVSDVISLALNDYIEIYVFCNGTAAVATGSNNTFFSGFLVSGT